jgi:hypothetical protein
MHSRMACIHKRFGFIHQNIGPRIFANNDLPLMSVRGDCDFEYNPLNYLT